MIQKNPFNIPTMIPDQATSRIFFVFQEAYTCGKNKLADYHIFI